MNQCPKCGRQWKERLVGLTTPDKPQTDDVLVCDGCGTILQFDKGQTLRIMPDSELQRMKRQAPQHYALAMFAQRMVHNNN